MPREHTPGPWTVDWLGCVRDARNEPIETASPNGPREGWANACIIAAAPDMVEALADCIVSLCAANLEHLPSLAKARAALSKAEGRDAT